MTAPVELLAAVSATAVVLVALLGAGEAAVLGISRAEVDQLADRGHPRSRGLARLVERAEATAAAVTLVRLLVETLLAASVALMWDVTGWPWWGVLTATVVTVGLVGLLVLRLGPRGLGARYPVGTLLLTGRMLALITPLARFLPVVHRHNDLSDIVDQVDEVDDLEEEEREMFRSVLELGSTLTREVMVPRTEMITVHESKPLTSALALLLRSGYSRIPVIGDAADDLRGIVYLKDVVRRMQDEPGDAEEPVVRFVRQPVFVPETKHVDDLLRDMQRDSTHMAIVVDEYGGVAGLVTIEDALEEIVGELTDEHDHSGPEVEDLGEGTFRVPSRLALDDLGDLFDLDISDDDVDSVGGLLAKALGKVPLAGAHAEVDGLRLVAERVEGRRKQVATLLVTRSATSGTRDEGSTPDPMNEETS